MIQHNKMFYNYIKYNEKFPGTLVDQYASKRLVNDFSK